MPYKDPEKRKEAAARYRKSDKGKAAQRRYIVKNPEKRKEYKQRWETKNPDKVKAQKTRSNSRCQQRIRDYQKQWILDNPDKATKSQQNRSARWRDKNPDYLKQYNKERRATDPQFNIQNRLRSRVGHAIKMGRGVKKEKTFDLVGCSISKLIEYLESLFLPDMTWENRLLWHIDHIIPCSSFDLTNEEEQKKCFHYTNLQPLWRLDNLRKGSKIN